MTLRPLVVVCCSGVLLTACKATPATDGPSLQGGQPAVIVNPTAESRAELQRVVSDMLSGADVMLADDALTDASTLTIERRHIRSLENPPLSGRDLGQPERFQLLTTGTACVLVHGPDKVRHELAETDCVPEE